MPGLAYTLGMNAGPAVAGVNAFKGALGGMHSAIGKISGVLGVLGISFAAFKGGAAFADSLKGIFEAGKELNTTRAITGQTVTDLVTLRKAFSEVGIAPEGLEESLIKLQKSLGGVNEEGKPTGHIFAQQGLSISQLKGESATQQLEKIGGAINKLGSQADRTFATMEIFGRAGAPMMALFGDTHAIEDARRSMAAYAGIMEKDAGMFKSITNDLESLHGKVKGFFVGFADQIGPVLLPLLEKLKGFNLVDFGKDIGGAIKKVSMELYGLFQNGTLAETAGLALRVGFADGIDYLTKKLADVWEAAGKDAPAILKSLAEGLKGMGNVFKGLGMQMGAAIVSQLAGVMAEMKLFGRPILGAETAKNVQVIAKQAGHDGQVLVGMGTRQMEEEGAKPGSFAGTLKSFVSAFKTDLDGARLKLEGRTRWAELYSEIKGVGVSPGIEALKKDGPGILQQRQPEIIPMSDRLAKIGGFIGGNGGVKGERAALDTARNTANMSEMLKRTNEILLMQTHVRKATTF